MVLLETTKHDAVGEKEEPFECNPTWTVLAMSLERDENFLVENGEVAQRTVTAGETVLRFAKVPRLQSTGTASAEIVAERTDVEKLNQGEKFANDILQRSARQAPSICSFQCEAGSGRRSSASLDG